MGNLHVSFNTLIAAKYGVNEAIIIYYFQSCIKRGRELKRNFNKKLFNRTCWYSLTKEFING